MMLTIIVCIAGAQIECTKYDRPEVLTVEQCAEIGDKSARDIVTHLHQDGYDVMAGYSCTYAGEAA